MLPLSEVRLPVLITILQRLHRKNKIFFVGDYATGKYEEHLQLSAELGEMEKGRNPLFILKTRKRLTVIMFFILGLPLAILIPCSFFPK